MDGPTLVLMAVVTVVAASQLMQHVGGVILRPYVFWPVQALLFAALVVILAAPLSEWQPQIRTGIRVFLALFLVWRLVQNWMSRERVRRRHLEEHRARRADRGKPPATGSP